MTLRSGGAALAWVEVAELPRPAVLRGPPRLARRPLASGAPNGGLFGRLRGALAATAAAALSNRLRRKGPREASEDGLSATAIVWHRVDLRTDDNPALCRAADLVRQGKVDAVLPVYVIDPRHFGTTPWGSPKTGAFRAKFILESLASLKKRLRDLGSDLLVAVGRTEQQLAEIAERTRATCIITEQQLTDEELRMDKSVRSAVAGSGAELEEVWGNTLYHLEDIPFASSGLADLPKVFTPFKEKCEGRCKIRPPMGPPAAGAMPLPEEERAALDFLPSWEDLPYEGDVAAPEAHPQSALTVAGGEDAALARLRHYLWDTDAVATYFDVRNGMLGPEYSTKFSASLAQGCISARRIHQDLLEYQEQRTSNKSTYWVKFELTWRDYFRFGALKHRNRIFKRGGITNSPKAWSTDAEALQRWKDGTTGWPLIDANMRELKQTGFMSNRGRQNVASFLTLDLGIDWRAGADHFESLLVDYDCAVNWGNWAAAAGLTGGRINKFNIPRQAKVYDEDGAYARAWLPELGRLPGFSANEPWKRTPEDLKSLGAQDYPPPLLGSGHFGGGGGGGRGGRGGQPRQSKTEGSTPMRDSGGTGRGRAGRGGRGR